MSDYNYCWSQRNVGEIEFYYPKDEGGEELILLLKVTERTSLQESELLLLLPLQVEVRLLPISLHQGYLLPY